MDTKKNLVARFRAAAKRTERVPGTAWIEYGSAALFLFLGIANLI